MQAGAAGAQPAQMVEKLPKGSRKTKIPLGGVPEIPLKRNSQKGVERWLSSLIPPLPSHVEGNSQKGVESHLSRTLLR